MMLVNDVLEWFLSFPPIYWLSQQPVLFLSFGFGFLILLLIAWRGMRGPEI